LRASLSRKKQLKDITRESLPRLAEPFPLPARVTMTRHGKRLLDTDNLARALKSVRDVIADWLGVDDGRAEQVGHVIWCVQQIDKREPLVRVRVETVVAFVNSTEDSEH
jgi:hypothetical protein